MAANDTLIDAAPRPPVTVDAVLDDAALAWQLCERNGPYAHVLMLAEFAASMQAYRDAATSGSPDAVGVVQGTEFLTMPIYRGNWAFAGQPHIDGVDAVLHNERLIEAARTVFDAEIVRPQIVYSNLTAPMPQNRKHTDVPTFRGVQRADYPAWVVSGMAASGLFERWRVKMATAVAWYYDGPNGGFSYWPDGADAPEITIEPPSNTAVVGDNDFMFHRVEAVGDGGPANVLDAMVPIDSLLDFGADRRWRITKDDREFAEYAPDQIRISISWKAECFHDAEDARVYDEHVDDITFEQVHAMWRADCEARGVPLPPTDDPIGDPAFSAAIAAAYSGPLNTR